MGMTMTEKILAAHAGSEHHAHEKLVPRNDVAALLRHTHSSASKVQNDTTSPSGFYQNLALAIMLEEVGEVRHGLAQHTHARQVDDAEVIRLRPVESAAVDEEDLLFPE